jgi:hypothetical protein
MEEDQVFIWTKLMSIVDKAKDFINKMNAAGVPIPLIRLNGSPTLTGTMVVLSFTTALLGQLGKLSKVLGEVDLSQANYLLLICLSAYLGRKFQGNGKDVTVDKDESPKP